MISLLHHLVTRARKERLPQIAGSLTFTTVLSIVPLLAVSFALFAQLPMLTGLGRMLEGLLVRSLLPEDIAQVVLKYLSLFAAKAGALTLVGSGFLLLTAMAMMLTVENAFNQIWQVRRGRPWHRRLGLYLLMLAVAPPALGASLWATSTVQSISAGLLADVPRWAQVLLQLGPVLLGTLVLAGAFRIVPHAPVAASHALVGGLVGSAAFELGKRGFAAYVLKLPTYKAVYGAFAVVPLFLLWIYFSWLVTLVAALFAAGLGRGRKG